MKLPKHCLGLVCLVLLLVACGVQIEPFEPTPVSEIPDGPGLFTGDNGKWEIDF